MNQNKKTSILFFLATLIGLFVLVPFYQEYLIERVKLSAEEEKLKIEDRNLEALRATERDLRVHQEELDEIRKALPDNPSVNSVVVFVEERIRAHGLIFSEMDSFSIDNYPGKEPLKETIINLEIDGASYLQIKRFLADLESSIKIIAVENIFFEPDEEGERFSFTLTLKTYSY